MTVNKDIEKMNAKELHDLSVDWDILGNYHDVMSEMLQLLSLLKTAKNLELAIKGKAENGCEILYSTSDISISGKALNMCVMERINDALNKLDLKYDEILITDARV